MERYNVIGIMSGTSLDGLDICYCSFSKSINNQWQFNIINTNTIKLSTQLKDKLSNAVNYSGIDLAILNNEFGNFIGQSVNNFIKKNNINKKNLDFISSHGHTIYHQPQSNLTLQIGNGANISAITQLPVICDYRTTDVALDGQGAPLVPIGDELLFSNYDYCLNLGGIANISFKNKIRYAFDICPVNIVLNTLATKLGLEYDNEGLIAKSGLLNTALLEKLNSLEYYEKDYPKSLGIEWVNKNIFPVLESSNISIEDQLRTLVEHISIQVSKQLNENSTTLITGGGTYNTFLIDRIKETSSSTIILPDKNLIEFKEALIFGFLGVLRIRREVNILNSVTGASFNNVGGCVYEPIPNS